MGEEIHFVCMTLFKSETLRRKMPGGFVAIVKFLRALYYMDKSPGNHAKAVSGGGGKGEIAPPPLEILRQKMFSI